MLIDMLCKNKDYSAINFVKEQLNFRSEILLKLVTSEDVPIMFRSVGIYLLTCTCVLAAP